MYLTYEEYKNNGGTVEETAFPLLELKARKKLDYWTQDRITESTEEIRLIMTILVDHYASEQDGEQDVSSVSNDGISLSFADAKTSEQKLMNIYDYAVEILPVELVSVCV